MNTCLRYLTVGWLTLVLAAMLLPRDARAQQKTTVSGSVREAGGPLARATISEKGVPANIVSSGADGEFHITLRGTSNTLIISFVNFSTEEVKIKDPSKQVTVMMRPSPKGMDEVTVVGFGNTKQKATETGAVSSINAKEIQDVPTSSVQNALAGQVSGFVAVQRSGQPGHDASDFYIRGVSSLNPAANQPLILVDDIEYTYDQLSQINVNEIETITLLKDASSTAIYGIKGASGVMLVTTKRGVSGRSRFDVRMESGAQSPVIRPKFLDSYHSAILANEALNNDGLKPQFTTADLQTFANKSDPYGHPNVNWYKAIMRPISEQANADIDISGGTSNVKYFINGGAFTQNGTIRGFSTNSDGVNSNYFYNRFTLRSNLDIQASRNLSLRVDATVRYMDINNPHGVNVVNDIYNYNDYHPFSAPFINPNGSYSYAYDTQSQLPTLNALLSTNGYDRTRRTDFNVLAGFTEKLDDITRGLRLTGRLAYASQQENVLTLWRGFGFPPSYHYNPSANSYTLNTGPSGGGYVLQSYSTMGGTDLDNQRVNAQIFLNYDRLFNNAHHINSLLLWNEDNFRDDLGTTLGTTAGVPQKYQGYSLKLGYDYKQRYLADFNAGYNGSSRFQTSHQFGFFPAAGIGWNMSKENFWSPLQHTVDLAKIRGSYGLVGSDVALGNQYLYQQVYNSTTPGYSFGQSAQNQTVIAEGALGNNNVTWQKSRKYDIGFDLGMFNDKLTSTTDYFHEHVYNQLVVPGNVPLILGIGLSPDNVGITQNKGWEETLTWRDRIGKVTYSVGIVYTHNHNKILYEAEAAPRFPWLAATGHQINQPFGYVYQGFYSAADVADPKVARPNIATPIQPGDLKYKDLNGDGVIDQNDVKAIGNPNVPNTTVGLPVKIGYKGFDLSVLFQGAFDYSLYLYGVAIEPFQSQWQPIHLKRWTPETANSAEFPRLTTNATTINSPAVYSSTFWLVNAYYIRVKSVDLNYNLPPRALPFHIRSARVYLSAYNLFTWSNVKKKYQQDPEVQSNTVGDAYLNQRILNLGIQVGL
jgi:TonB-linked SusC/RagA family outer membrane protein